MLDGLTSVSDVPDTVPAVVRNSITGAVASVCPPEEVMNDRWGTSMSYIIQLRCQLGSSKVTGSVRFLDFGAKEGEAHRSGDLLSALLALGPSPQPAVGIYVGVLFVSEFLETEDIAPAASLHAFYAEQVAAGAKQGLSAVGVMTSGWRFAVSRDRHALQPLITIVEPLEPWGDAPEVIEALAALNDTFALHG